VYRSLVRNGSKGDGGTLAHFLRHVLACTGHDGLQNELHLPHQRAELDEIIRKAEGPGDPSSASLTQLRFLRSLSVVLLYLQFVSIYGLDPTSSVGLCATLVSLLAHRL